MRSEGEPPLEQLGLGARAAQEGAAGIDRMGDSLKKYQERMGAFRSGIRGFVADLAVGAGASIGFSVAMTQVRKSLEALARGFELAAQKNKLEQQFRTLLGGAEAARKRVAELAAVAKNGFSLRSLGQANAQLQVVTQGALSGARAFRDMADAAAGSDNDIVQLSSVVGTLYARLSRGEPIADVAGELEAMGVISAAARHQMETLASSGAGFAATFAVAEGELKKFRGGAEEVSKTLSGLGERIRAAQATKDAGVASQFTVGMQAGAEAEVKIIEATAASAADAARPVAALFNWLMKLKLAVVSSLTSWQGFSAVLSTVSTILASVFIPLMIASAASMVRSVAALGRVAIQAIGASRAFVGLAAAARGAGLALSFTRLGLGVVTAAATFFALKILEADQRAKEFAERMNQQRKAGDEAADALRKQASAVQTLSDKSRAQIAALEKLSEAESEYAAAVAKREEVKDGDVNKKIDAGREEAVAQGNLAKVRAEYDRIAAIREDSLAPEQEALQLALERYQIERQIAQTREDAVADRLSGKEKIDFLEGQKDSADVRLRSGEAEQAHFVRDRAEFDPLRRAFDIAETSEQKQEAQANIDKFLNAPGRSEIFLASRGIDERQEAQTRIAAREDALAKAQRATDPFLQDGFRVAPGAEAAASVAEKDLANEKAAAVARFGSLDEVTPSGIARRELDRKKLMVERGLDPGTGMLDNATVQRRAMLSDKITLATLEEGERTRQVESTARGNVADAAIIGLSGVRKKGREHDVATAEIRKKQIDEDIKAMATRKGVPGFDDRETDASIEALRNQRVQIDKDLADKREEGVRTLRGAKGELRAQRLEEGGGKEAAAKQRAAIQVEERILQLRAQGLTNEEATKQARAEARQDRRNRRAAHDGGGESTAGMFDPANPAAKLRVENTQKALDAINSLRVDSMSNIGGNAGAGEGTQGLVREIRDMLKRANFGYLDAPKMPPQWDDAQQDRVRSPF